MLTGAACNLAARIVFFLGKIPKLIPGIDPLKFSQKEIRYFPDQNVPLPAGVDPLILWNDVTKNNNNGSRHVRDAREARA